LIELEPAHRKYRI